VRFHAITGVLIDLVELTVFAWCGHGDDETVLGKKGLLCGREFEIFDSGNGGEVDG
jgi:hypothetical protein